MKPKCPKCGNERRFNIFYDQFDVSSQYPVTKFYCSSCGYFEVVDSENGITHSNNYTLEFSYGDADAGIFTGTKEEIHNKIDSYKWCEEQQTIVVTSNIKALKYGFLDEFRYDDYKSYEITANKLWMRISLGIK